MGGRRGNGDQALSSGESGRCVTLVIMKGLLWRISHRDRVPPSGAAQEERMEFQLIQAKGFCLSHQWPGVSLLMIWSLSVW